MAQKSLTRQEQLFMARVAAKLVAADGEISFEQAARQVLADDIRLFKAVCNKDELRKAAVTHLSDSMYVAVRKEKQLSTIA